MDLRKGEIFDLALMNPTPRSSKTKDGPVYRVSFEVDQETFLAFMAADTAGMIIAAKAMVTEDGQFWPPQDGPKRPYGGFAAQVAARGVFRSPKVWRAIGTDADFQAWCHAQPCTKCGASPPSVYAHYRTIRAGAGTAIKPAYSGLPLCDACHTLQHQKGHDALWDRGAWAEHVVRSLSQWAWSAARTLLGVASMGEARPQDLEQLLVSRGGPSLSSFGVRVEDWGGQPTDL